VPFGNVLLCLAHCLPRAMPRSETVAVFGERRVPALSAEPAAPPAGRIDPVLHFATSVSVPFSVDFGASLLPSTGKASTSCSGRFFCRCPLMSCAAYLFPLRGTVRAFGPRSRLGLSVAPPFGFGWDRARARRPGRWRVTVLALSVCEAGSQFHQGCVSRGPPIMPDNRISQVRFEALAFRP